MKRRDTFARWMAIGAVSCILAGCSPTETRHGHLLPKQAAQELSQADLTQDRVIQLLGTPSAFSAFDRNKWFYVSEIQQNFAFFKPDVVAREILILEFDDRRRLQRVAMLTEKDGQEVTLVARETPTEGHKITLMEQLLGNLGRFNTPEGQP